MAKNLSTFTKSSEAYFLFMFADRHQSFPQISKRKFILCQLQKYCSFPCNGYNQISSELTNATFQALQERWNENDIEAFLKTVGSFQRYSHIKTPTLHLNFETWSDQFIQLNV